MQKKKQTKKKIELENRIKEVEQEKDKWELEKRAAKAEKEKEKISREKEASRKKLRVLKGFASVLAALTLVIIYLAYTSVKERNRATKAEKVTAEEKYLMISKSLVRAGNPTFAYLIASDWLKNHPSDTVFRYLQGLDTSSYIYLTGVYPDFTDILWADIRGDNLVITETEKDITWNLHKQLISGTPDNSNNRGIPTLTTEGRKLNVRENAGLFIIKNEDNKTIFNVDRSYNSWRNITLSDSSRYLCIDGDIFVPQSPKSIAKIPAYKIKNKIYSQTISLFLNASQIVVGYETGDIFIYELDKRQKITFVDTVAYGQSDAGENNRIMCLAYEKTQQLLFVGNSYNAVNVYDLKKNLSGKISKDTREFDPLFTLSGHTGNINCMSFSSDKKMLITGSNDNTAIVWNIETRKPAAILKGPESAEINYVSFANADTAIISISSDFAGDSRVYVWKKDRPSSLYKKKELYRFSAFNYYDTWLNENKDGRSADTSLTTELYKANLNYYLNIPGTNDTDDNNKQLKVKATTEAKTMYLKLTNRKDYTTEIPAPNIEILYNYYFDFLPKIERDIITAGQQISKWQKFLSDTTDRITGNGLLRFIALKASIYLDRPVDYSDGMRFIKYYQDSVWQPLNKRFGTNRTVKRAGREIDYFWLKYYLYTRKNSDALEKAVKISNFDSKSLDSRVSLVAVYLASNKYDEAVLLYDDILKNSNGVKKTNNDRQLSYLLKTLKDKNIASDQIEKFMLSFAFSDNGQD